MKILYQDERVVVVEKPAGLAVQGGAGVAVCVTDILARQLGGEVFPVHRLDKDTAGALVVARSKQAAALYTDFFSGKKIAKRYHAVCVNAPERLSGEIRAPLEKKSGAGHPRGFQDAVTFYRVEKTRAGGDFCFVSLRIETGRMHQIRRHLALKGFPVAGDDKYGDFKRNREIRRLYGIKKLQLAATSITLPVFSSDGTAPFREAARVEISCALPAHMEACLAVLFP